MHCKMEDITLPMERGHMDDIAQDTEGQDSSQTSDRLSQLQYDKESR